MCLELKARNAVNEISCLTGHSVLGMRPFSPRKFVIWLDHDVFSVEVLMSSAVVWSLYLIKVNGIFPFYFVILKAIFSKYFHEFFPHLMHFASLVKGQSVLPSTVLQMFWGKSAPFSFFILKLSFTSSRKQKWINNCKDHKSSSISLVILKLMASNCQNINSTETRTDRFVWRNICFDWSALFHVLSSSPSQFLSNWTSIYLFFSKWDFFSLHLVNFLSLLHLPIIPSVKQ